MIKLHRHLCKAPREKFHDDKVTFEDTLDDGRTQKNIELETGARFINVSNWFERKMNQTTPPHSYCTPHTSHHITLIGLDWIARGTGDIKNGKGVTGVWPPPPHASEKKVSFLNRSVAINHGSNDSHSHYTISLTDVVWLISRLVEYERDSTSCKPDVCWLVQMR